MQRPPSSDALTTAGVAKREGQEAYNTARDLVQGLRQRTLTDSDVKQIADLCKSFARPDIPILIRTNVMGLGLAIKIFQALSNAGFKPNIQSETAAFHEISLAGPLRPPIYWDATVGIDSALLSTKKLVIFGPLLPLSDGSPVTIIVGEKIPDLPKSH
jgi:hypothetical protein